MMVKFSRYIMTAFVLFVFLEANALANDTKPQIVVSIAPLKAILEEIVKDRAEVTKLLPAGASPHTYAPKPSDVKKVQSALLVFHFAHGIDSWILKLPIKKAVEVIEFLPENMRLPLIHGSHDHGHHGHDAHEEGKTEKEKYDAHFWTDPLAVKAVIPGIVEELCKVSANNCKLFESNAKVFMEKLDELNDKLIKLTENVNRNAVLLSHPFFFYFLKRYKFVKQEVIEKIPGKQPTPKSLAKIFRFVKEEKVKTVFSLKQLSKKPAQIVANSTGVKTVEIDPIGGTSELKTYEDIILKNAILLVNGLK